MDSSTASVYNDFSGLARLKQQARVAPQQAAKEVAQQFESLFVSMVLKAMRDAVPQDELFGSDQLRSYQGMFDQQLALDLSNSGGLGLAQIIERQITDSSRYRAEEGE